MDASSGVGRRLQCGHQVNLCGEGLCDELVALPEEDACRPGVLAELAAVIRRIEQSDDIGAFLRGMDRVDAFSCLSASIPRHPSVLKHLVRFRDRFGCVDCRPVEYLQVRIKVARMMTGSKLYDKAKALLVFLRQEAARVTVEVEDERVRAAIPRLMRLIDGYVECTERGVMNLF